MTTVTPRVARRTRARRGEGEQLREAIIEATTRLVAELGSVDAVTMRRIARTVGVTPPSIYRHFADKTELLFACCRLQFERLTSSVTEVLARVEEPVERLLAIGRAYAEWGLAHPEAYRLLFITAHPHVPGEVDEAHAAAACAYALLVGCLRDAVAAGALRPGDPDLDAIGCWAVMHGAVSLLLTAHEHDHDHPGLPVYPEPGVLVGHVLATYLEGLRAP